VKSYGTYELKGDTWRIVTQAHVAGRLKRVFGRAARKRTSTIFLRNTDEVCRDLEWFLLRFHHEPKRERDHAALSERATAHRQRVELLERVLNGTADPRTFELAIPARQYQLVAAEAALQSGGLLVADDLGLGKTLVGICCLTAPEARPGLVVTATHLVRQWQREFAKFAPAIRTHVVKKGRPYDVGAAARGGRKGQLALPSEEPDVLIMNYHKLAGWSDHLAGKVRGVVFDECQELRREGSQKYNAALDVASGASMRCGLSATPIYNYGGEIFNVTECIRPGALGTWTEFSTEWCRHYIDRRKAQIVDPKAFGTYMRDEGLMVRRTREGVGREVPEVSIVPHHIDCDTDAIEAIGRDCAELCKTILSPTEQAKGARMQASGELDYRLRQQTGIAKAPFVARFVDMLVDSGEKVVLFGWHHAVYDVWEAVLAAHKPVRFTGEQSAAAKDKAREAFVEGDSRVLLMSLRAGAGLDGLQHARATGVFGELDWSPGVHEQCVGRVHRDGQTRPVVAYYLLADEGSDPVISDVLGVKEQQIRGLKDPDAPLLKQSETPKDRIRLLAEQYAAKHGVRTEAA
jgi:SNF2 family DNA or RNA helicase